MPGPALLIAGSIAFDDITTPRARVPRVLGGSGVYAALAASFFSPVRLVAIAGEDFTSEDEAVLGHRGVDTRGIMRAPGKTFFWACEYGASPNHRRTLHTELNVCAEYNLTLPVSYTDSSSLFLANIAPRQQCALCDQMGGRASFVGGDTMNSWITAQPAAVTELLRRLDLLLINDSEAQLLSGEPNLVRAGRLLLERGPSAVVIKRGEHGATLYSRTQCFGMPGYPLADVVDPTGAGDAFAGGLLGHLTRQERCDDATLRQAVVYGSVMGSFTCESFGVERLARLTPEEVEDRYQSFAAMTRLDPEPAEMCDGC